MIASVKAERDAYTAYAEHGSATVNVGVRIATALPGPLVPDAPDLPAGYRPREADIAALKSLLISGDGNTGIVGRARAAGLRGMGGLGKTVLATALVQDPDVRNAFPYGVVWLNFGREADAVTLLNVLARAATGQPLSYTTVGEARADLARIFGDRRFLLVLDDIWEPALVDGFRGLVPGCHLLITTREQAVLDRAGAHSHAVGLLDTYASRTLFAQTLGSADLPDEADPVIAACSGLPLALAAAAGMVRRRGWRHTQEAFKRGRLDALKTRWLPDSEQENLAIVLAASVEALPTRQRACFLECAIWPEDVPIPTERPGPLLVSLRIRLVRSGGRSLKRSPMPRSCSVTRPERCACTTYTTTTYDIGPVRTSRLCTARSPIAVSALRKTATSWSTLRIGHWRTCPGISRTANRSAQAKALLLDFHWLASKLATYGVQALIADTQLIDDSELQQLGRALRLSAHVLARDPSELAAQLVGRLRDLRGPGTTQLLTDAANSVPADALLPRGGKHLTAPGALVATLTGHNSSVRGALLLPDGRRALSWSDDNTLRLWDLETGATRTFEGHNSSVRGALLLPDGRRALSWSDDNTLRLWDLETGAARTFEGHNSSVRGALLLPDGRRALSWSDDNTLRLWDLETGAARTFEGHNSSVSGALLLPDGRRALSWSDDNTLRLWDLETGAARTFEGHNGRSGARCCCPTDAVPSPGQATTPCGSGTSKPARREPSRATTARSGARCCCPTGAVPSPGRTTHLAALGP